MVDPYEGLIDKLFFLVALLIMALVALKPDAFIRGITLGRSSSNDVSHAMLRTTQIIAGVAAVAIAISLALSLLKAK